MDGVNGVRPSWVLKVGTISMVFGTESVETIGRVEDSPTGCFDRMGLIVGAIVACWVL